MSNVQPPMTTQAGFGQALSPTEQANFIIERLQEPSAFLRSGVRQERTIRETYAMPREGGAMPEPQWVPEATPLPEAVISGDLVTVHMHKLGIVIPMSNELVQSSEPEALNAVGGALARALARKLDATAFVGDPASGWDGLAAQPDIRAFPNPPATSPMSGVDLFKHAAGMVRAAGGRQLVAVVGPACFTAISHLKTTTGEPLVAGVPDDGSTIPVLGMPVYSAASLDTTGDGYVYDPTCLGIVWRLQADISSSDQERFSSDMTVVRAVLRCGFFVADPLGIVRISGLPTDFGNEPEPAPAPAPGDGEDQGGA